MKIERDTKTTITLNPITKERLLKMLKANSDKITIDDQINDMLDYLMGEE